MSTDSNSPDPFREASEQAARYIVVGIYGFGAEATPWQVQGVYDRFAPLAAEREKMRCTLKTAALALACCEPDEFGHGDGVDGKISYIRDEILAECNALLPEGNRVTLVVQEQA